MRPSLPILVLELLVLLGLVCGTGSTSNSSIIAGGQRDGHTNNWAVLVCASRYWFNYRHIANTLGMYRTVKRLGIPDSNIILMLADDMACNARNAFPGKVYANAGRQLDLYGSQGEGVEVDYRGYEVSVESFLRVLTGRTPSHLPPSKHLRSDASSNVFLYLTGHGGNEFLKFQDNEEVSAFDIGDAIGQMWEKRRYNRMLFMVDTCQANTLYNQINSPNVLMTGSSELGENSYSHHNDADIGVAVIDSFTHYILQYLEEQKPDSQATLQEFFDMFDPANIKSHPGLRTDLFPYNLSDTLITDFFGGVSKVEVTEVEKDVKHVSSMGAWDELVSSMNPRVSIAKESRSRALQSHRLAMKSQGLGFSGMWSLLGMIAIGLGAWRLTRSPRMHMKEKTS